MSMSRKHYVAIAAILAEARRLDPVDDVAPVDYIAIELSILMKRDNPAFQTGRFLQATREA